MKKAKFALGLVAGLVATMGLASCNETTYNEGVVLTYTDSQGNRVQYTAAELFGNYQKGSSAASTDFEKVYELLIRKYYAQDSQATALAAINKIAQSAVNTVKETAETNASTNGTSYEVEFEKLLTSNNCENVDELFDLKQYTEEKDEFERNYYADNMQIKQQALIAVDKTTDGWYTSSGLSSLPSELKTRLFKIGVANEVDSGKTGALDYGYYINNHYYLTSTVYQSDETSTSFPYVIYDKTTTTWYVIRVDEAVKLSKLAEGSGSYDAMTSHSGTDKTYWPIFRSTVAYEVAYLLSDTDTYKKSANQYYVEQAAIAYHDDYVYNYFKTTFPDLFD